MARRSSLSVIMILALTLLTAYPVAAADGTVTFRLTIRGTPPPTDSFTLGVNPDNGLIIDAGVLCGPGSDLYNPSHVPCEPGDIDFAVTVPVGTELSYTYARFIDYLATGGASGAQILLEGTITVAASPQTVTLVYDYSLGSGTAAPTELPDTSLEAPTESPWTLASVGILFGFIMVVARRRALRRFA